MKLLMRTNLFPCTYIVVLLSLLPSLLGCMFFLYASQTPYFYLIQCTFAKNLKNYNEKCECFDSLKYNIFPTWCSVIHTYIAYDCSWLIFFHKQRVYNDVEKIWIWQCSVDQSVSECNIESNFHREHFSLGTWEFKARFILRSTKGSILWFSDTFFSFSDTTSGYTKDFLLSCALRFTL